MDEKGKFVTMCGTISNPIFTEVQFVMTREEHSAHISRIIDKDDDYYHGCLNYDNGHHVVENEEEKLLWIKKYRSRHQRGNFYEELPADAKLVARPARWGSKFKVAKNEKELKKEGYYTLEESLLLYHNWLHEELILNPNFLKPLMRSPKYVKEGEIKHWKLTCYCSLWEDCHADILLMHLEGNCEEWNEKK